MSRIVGKRLKSIKVDEEVHSNLVRLQALYVLRDGDKKKWSISRIIQTLLEQQPEYKISAELIEKSSKS